MFRADNKKITLRLNGLEKGSGYVDITVETVPEWDRATGKGPAPAIVDDSDAL